METTKATTVLGSPTTATTTTTPTTATTVAVQAQHSGLLIKAGGGGGRVGEGGVELRERVGGGCGRLRWSSGRGWVEAGSEAELRGWGEGSAGGRGRG